MSRLTNKRNSKKKPTVTSVSKLSPLQSARKNLTNVTRRYKEGKSSIADVQKAASRLAQVSCKVKNK